MYQNQEVISCYTWTLLMIPACVSTTSTRNQSSSSAESTLWLIEERRDSLNRKRFRKFTESYLTRNNDLCERAIKKTQMS